MAGAPPMEKKTAASKAPRALVMEDKQLDVIAKPAEPNKALRVVPKEEKSEAKAAAARPRLEEKEGKKKNPYEGESFVPVKLYEPIESIKNDGLDGRHMMTLISAAVDDAGLVGHSINSFNRLMDTGLKHIVTQLFKIDRMIKNERTQTDRDRQHTQTRLQIEFSDVEVGKPTYNTYPIGQSADLYPNHARLCGLSYAGPVTLAATVTLTAHYLDGHEETKTAEVPSFQATRFPILVKSNRCHTANCSKAALKRLKEDPNDPGAYFISKSIEWTVDLLENIRFNTLHTHMYMGSSEIVRGEFISQPGGAFENSSQLVIRHMANGAITVEVNSTKLSKVRIPFYLVYRMFGMTSDRDIVSTVVHDLESASPVALKLTAVLERALQISDANFADLENELDRGQVVQKMAERLAKFLTNPLAYQTDDDAIRYLNENLQKTLDHVVYPHIGMTADSRYEKMRFLGLQIHRPRQAPGEAGARRRRLPGESLQDAVQQLYHIAGAARVQARAQAQPLRQPHGGQHGRHLPHVDRHRRVHPGDGPRPHRRQQADHHPAADHDQPSLDTGAGAQKPPQRDQLAPHHHHPQRLERLQTDRARRHDAAGPPLLRWLHLHRAERRHRRERRHAQAAGYHCFGVRRRRSPHTHDAHPGRH
jgi:hypothetical protein